MAGEVRQHRPPSQIEVLGKGLRLPLPAIDREHIEVILEIIQYAFSDISQDYPDVLRAGQERDINHLMVGRLCTMLRPSDLRTFSDDAPLLVLWRQLADTVARGSEAVSHDAEHLELRPDLNVYLTRGHPNFPLKIECKLIDAANRKPAKLYCDCGIVRFLAGDYGWGTREGIMLAYVRDGSSISSALAPLLGTVTGPNMYDLEQALAPIGPKPPDLAHSRHWRRFKYPGRPLAESEPGPIALWHLWLSVPALLSSSAAEST